MVYDETDTVAPIAAAIAGIPATAHSLGRQLPEPVRRAVFEPLSEVWRAHATSAETHDALFAGTIRMKPGGGPPLLHRHDRAEVDYVLDGSSPSTPATPRDPCGARPPAPGR